MALMLATVYVLNLKEDYFPLFFKVVVTISAKPPFYTLL